MGDPAGSYANDDVSTRVNDQPIKADVEIGPDPTYYVEQVGSSGDVIRTRRHDRKRDVWLTTLDDSAAQHVRELHEHAGSLHVRDSSGLTVLKCEAWCDDLPPAGASRTWHLKVTNEDFE